MMIPIPRRGMYRGVDGVEEARAVPASTTCVITAKPDQLLVPLPEGASYLGFIFARGATRGCRRSGAARGARAAARSPSTRNSRCYSPRTCTTIQHG